MHFQDMWTDGQTDNWQAVWLLGTVEPSCVELGCLDISDNWRYLLGPGKIPIKFM